MSNVEIISDKQNPAPIISADGLDISIVIPCLNEQDTLEKCLRKAQTALKQYGAKTEIIVADNGSTDNSAEIARKSGARVIRVNKKGYGYALMGGIAAARGTFIIIADADESHDLLEIPKFLDKLYENYEFVLGCRFPSGGGEISSNSMSFLHCRIGNPMFSFLVRRWYRVPVHDVNCGYRGFTKEFYERLDLRCTGMEFAVEMVIKSSFQKARIAEIPIRHYPDGRLSQPPHLRTFRDGWRTARFLLMYSPRWLFLLPGFSLVLLGLFVFGVSQYNSFQTAKNENNLTIVQTLASASLVILCGYQAILFAVFTKAFAINEGLLPEDKRFLQFFEIINLERGLTAAFFVLLAGIILLIIGISQSSFFDFSIVHIFFFGATLIAVGFQTILSGFFTSILGLKRK